MAEYTISSANLNAIERILSDINHDINVLNDNMGIVDNHIDRVSNRVETVYDKVESLAKEFYDFTLQQKHANAKSNAQQNLIKIRLEIEKRFGHYNLVRRNTLGILQADDLGIVKKETISDASEELMISTPGYWLAPCLVALAAWINDQKDLAEKALREGIKRNDEKTSLFFALICRRANRHSAALKWTQRYLANQDEENLDRKTVIILDAFASGLLGSDSEGIISQQMSEWLEHLSEKSGFIEQQTQQWSNAINLKRKPLSSNDYPYLRKYSLTWPTLQNIMEGAELHAEILSYFTAIFDQEVSTESLKSQLDDILNNLVTEFDEEEIPLKKEERYNQFVVDFDGDEDLAKQHMQVEQTAFEEHKDFTQLLTDAAMKPESSHASASTQKFAIALSKEWIHNAYNDIIATNRMKITHEINISIDSFQDKTTDGQNEGELVTKMNQLIDKEETQALAQCVLSAFEQFCLWGGAVIGLLGLVMIIMQNFLPGLIAAIAGVGLVINYFSKKTKLETNRQTIKDHFMQKRKNGTEILRAVLAEIVDFRTEFAEKDQESQKVLDFLEQISPEQYIRKLGDSNRKIYMAK